MSDPWQLLQAGEYAEAVKAYSLQIAAKPHIPAYENRATAYLLAGDLDAALADYAVAGFLDLTDSTVGDHAHLHVGAVLWMKQRHALAAALWRHTVQQVLKNRFTHTDAAGGVQAGCLLWFASARLGDPALRALADELLLKRLGKPGRWGNAWPAPLAAMLLGELPVPDLMAAASSPPAMANRQLCQAHFHAASLAHSQGNGDLAARHLQSSAETRAFIEIEYFLALHELRHRDPALASGASAQSIAP